MNIIFDISPPHTHPQTLWLAVALVVELQDGGDLFGTYEHQGGIDVGVTNQRKTSADMQKPDTPLVFKLIPRQSAMLDLLTQLTKNHQETVDMLLSAAYPPSASYYQWTSA